MAPEISTPWPAKITGRSAALMTAAASCSVASDASGTRRHRGTTGVAASQSNSQDACCASFVMSISTGPGRPDLAMTKASRTARATSSARVTR